MATVPLRSPAPALAVVLAALLAPAAAAADEAKPAGPAAAAPEPAAAPADPRAWENAPATRRSGFLVGWAPGFGVMSLDGYPNDVKKLGLARYHASVGARPAPVVSLWVGGALADWVNVGLGFTASQALATGGDRASSWAGGFHIELFPLFYVSDRLRDLGVMFDAGGGNATIVSPLGEKRVDSSAASLVGGGVFWEPLKAWRVRSGPFLMGSYLWSDTARRPAIFMGWRMSLYRGP